MATARKRWTTEEVLTYIAVDDSPDEDSQALEETFTDYIGVSIDDDQDESEGIRHSFSGSSDTNGDSEEEPSSFRTLDMQVSSESRSQDPQVQEDIADETSEDQVQPISSDTSDPSEELIVESGEEISEDDVDFTVPEVDIQAPASSSSSEEISQEEVCN